MMSYDGDHMDAEMFPEEGRSDPDSSSGEEDARSPLQRLSELSSVAEKDRTDRDRKFIAKLVKEEALQRKARGAFTKISCRSCYVDNNSYGLGRFVYVQDLSEDCEFCDILRTCQQHFADNRKHMRLHFGVSINDIQICFADFTVLPHDCNSKHVQLYSKESRIVTPFRYAKDIHESAGSQASINIMKRWISDCRKFHQHVSPTRNLIPRRLIKLGRWQDDEARLYSAKHPVIFAALSYRWGSGKQSETTNDNVVERYQELKTSDFPKTLQDAIYVARRLGLEYIWIDRVCIIQDDKEDWAKEASLMADIYASAHVVLSATATEHCEHGFLGKRPKPLLIQNVQYSQETQELRARQIDSHRCQRREPRLNYTLYGRGWCMQERLLASRIIHFLPDEILFECQAGRKCECGGASREKEHDHNRNGYNSFGRLQAAKSMEDREFANNWIKIVNEYSRTKLTYGKDSLPALSGIAASVQHLNPGKYIAGLWEKGIGTQLGWYIDTNDNPTRRWEDPKDINILGPTFSWSSHVMGPVRHIHNGTGVRFLCTLESFNIELATSNPYGQIRDATICLSGWSVPGYDMIVWLKTPTTVKDRLFALYFDSGFVSMYTDFASVYGRGVETSSDHTGMEELENTIDWESVMCFGLYGDHHDIDDDDDDVEKYWVDALLVQPSQTDVRKYVRIGVANYLDRSWFKNIAVARTITLV